MAQIAINNPSVGDTMNREISSERSIELVNEMFVHAYKKGAFNDLPPEDIANMLGIMSHIRKLAQDFDANIKDSEETN